MKPDNKNLMSIGPFQFENLVRGRIPFYLVAIEVDPVVLIKDPRMVMEKNHLQKCIISSNVKSPFWDFSGKAFDVEAERLLALRSMEKDAAILVISEEDKTSVKLAKAFVKCGYHNVYYVEGGMDSLKF